MGSSNDRDHIIALALYIMYAGRLADPVDILIEATLRRSLTRDFHIRIIVEVLCFWLLFSGTVEVRSG